MYSNLKKARYILTLLSCVATFNTINILGFAAGPSGEESSIDVGTNQESLGEFSSEESDQESFDADAEYSDSNSQDGKELDEMQLKQHIQQSLENVGSAALDLKNWATEETKRIDTLDESAFMDYVKNDGKLKSKQDYFEAIISKEDANIKNYNSGLGALLAKQKGKLQPDEFKQEFISFFVQFSNCDSELNKARKIKMDVELTVENKIISRLGQLDGKKLIEFFEWMQVNQNKK